jgi:hypothetical protein
MFYLKYLFLFPGVFLHELSHYIIGLLLNAKPINFHPFPSKQNGSFGHVAFKNINNFNALPTAIAPIIGGLVGVFFTYSSLQLLEFQISVEYTIHIYLIFVFSITAIPSSVDIKVLFSKPIGLIFWLCLTYFLFEFYLI